MYLTAKKEGSEITLKQLEALGKSAHGRPVWEKTREGLMEKIYDAETKCCMLPDAFRGLQRERADARRNAYPNGHRERRGRTTHSFAPQDIGTIWSH